MTVCSRCAELLEITSEPLGSHPFWLGADRHLTGLADQQGIARRCCAPSEGVLSYTGRSADFSILPCPIQETVRSQSSALKIPEDAGTHMAYAVPCSGIVLLGSLGAEAWIKRLLLPGTPKSPVHRCGICGLAIRSLIRPGTSAPRQQ
ncbi:hypothetical protein DTO063F5_6905 [Paecilomyces variotii]|nr:hypothetical protein DTO063F5_6905 [Paecilomyces variotii]